MKLKEEIREVLITMASDINFKMSKQIEEYLTSLVMKSIFNEFENLNLKENNTKESLYTIAEFNLIRATIITLEHPDLHIKMAQTAYNRLFDLYTDELAFDILADIKNIIIILFGIKHFAIRDNFAALIEAKGKSSYINILLLKKGYLDVNIDE